MHPLRPVLAFLIALSVCSSMPLSAQSPAAPSEKTGTNGSDNEKLQIPGTNGVSLPVCKYNPIPRYTDEAKAAKFKGTVFVESIVDVDGKITHVQVIKSPGFGLDESVIDTLKKWKCIPSKDRNGKPVPVRIAWSFRFPH